MRDKPDAANLLATARDLMRTRIVPELPEAERYNGLLIASAMAIVARELAAGDAAPAAERAALRELLDAGEAPIADLNREFARLIRSGDFDAPAPRRDFAYRVLREATLAKLEECNPAYLDPKAR
jgi:hypothetical protein